MHKDQFCVIVDAYSTGNQLYNHFNQYGYTVIHVQSSKEISPIFEPSFRRKDFTINIIHNGNLKETVAIIRKYEPSFIVPGAETGVELANEIAKELNLKRNDDDKVHARRNKYLMNEIIREKGLPTVEQIKTGDLIEAKEWAVRLNKWPLVVKPLHSAASDGVNFCHNKEGLDHAFNELVNKRNSLGILNDEILVQRYLDGQHYVVNAITYEGKHFITDIWTQEFHKGAGVTVIYDSISLVPYNDVKHAEIVRYVKSTIDALGVKYGPTHTELRLTEEGPRLIEVNCRTMGLSLKEEIISEALSYSYSSLTADCYANPEKIVNLVSKNKMYKINNYISLVFLITSQEGIIDDIPGLKFLESLPSFGDVQLNVKKDDELKKTINVETHPGFILFTSDSPTQIESDYRKLRDLENKNLFFKTKELVLN
ncbi:ATP-grasp domain-containing protein [Priestia aryabhattai]|uniref:ATP-grasp domain-containing protein n=1 Tax=Priestia aryabhattai TaxID=412384 RepID=UPI001ADAA3F3|nr:ATP-grasp domain-containing protein [Priestia aryabhattai]QTL52727.1 ATP-grasp domain-containing protein [Priestia aryabhattai]